MNDNAVAQDDKTMALIAHLSGIVVGFLGPLVIWLMNKDKADKGWLNEQVKEALNFQITVVIGYIIGTILTMVLIGILVVFAVLIGNLILCIIAGMKANEGVSYRYPFALRLIK